MKFGNENGMMIGGQQEINNKKPIHPEKLEALANAEIILEAIKGGKISEDDFVDETKSGFTKKEIEADKQYVCQIKEKINTDLENSDLSDTDLKKIEIGEKRGKALEGVINLAAKRDDSGKTKYNWYGKNAYFVETSLSDDIVKGVDGVLEFDMGEGQSHKIALAIDASMRADVSSVKRKMRRGAERVASGHSEVKYFKSAVNDYKGKLHTVIPIVLGLEGDNANKLIRQFAEIITLENRKEKSVEAEENLAYKIREMQNHPGQILFLKEIKIQLEMHQKIFNRKGSFIENDLKELLKIIDVLLEDKKSVGIGELESDGIYECICKVAKQLPLEKAEILAGKKIVTR